MCGTVLEMIIGEWDTSRDDIQWWDSFGDDIQCMGQL